MRFLIILRLFAIYFVTPHSLICRHTAGERGMNKCLKGFKFGFVWKVVPKYLTILTFPCSQVISLTFLVAPSPHPFAFITSYGESGPGYWLLEMELNTLLDILHPNTKLGNLLSTQSGNLELGVFMFLLD